MNSAERVFIGLGGNVGDVAANLATAFEAMARLPRTLLVARSSLYRSAPIDAGGSDYINAVAELATPLAPTRLLLALQRIEADAGRVRPYHHAPRTLDLDLLLYGQRCVGTPELQLPHPRLHRRAFVLVPLLEIEPDLSHPMLGRLADHLGAVADQAIKRLS